MNNCKQMGLATMQYIQDYDESYPLYNGAGGPFDVSNPLYGWGGVLQPYIKNFQVFQCPSEGDTYAPTTNVTNRGYMDYSMNFNVGGGHNYATSGHYLTPTRESQFEFPANTTMIMDWRAVSGGDTTRDPPKTWVDLKASYPNEYAAVIRHLEGANYTFADGHAKWLKPTAFVYSPVTATNYAMVVAN